MPFVKLDCALLTSSLWPDPAASRLFITALLMCKSKTLDDEVPQIQVNSLDETGWKVPAGEYGFVEAAGTGLVWQATLPQEQGLAALEALCSPDRQSRDQRFEGRRMARVNGGYLVLNYIRYREKDSTQSRVDTPGYVYYIGVPGSDRVKIGFSKNPWARIKDIKATNTDFQLLGVEKGTLEVYQQRRRFFASLQMSGGWFRITAQLLKHITTVATKGLATVAATKEGEGEVEGEGEGEGDINHLPTTHSPTTTAGAKNSTAEPSPGPTTLQAATPPAPQPLPEQQVLHLHGSNAKKAPKTPKEPKLSGARYPSLSDPAHLVNAWTVWVDILRDRGFPDPIVDPEDLRFSKILSASIQSRTELEWIFNDYLNDDEDPWLAANFPHPASRPLHFIRSKVARYRLTIAKSKNPTTGDFPPYAYGTFTKAATPQQPPRPPTAKQDQPQPDDQDQQGDPADALLHELESQI